MASVVHGGPRGWKGFTDRDGRRQYKIWHIVRSGITDGPATVMVTPGLPLVGSLWNFLNDSDENAVCWPNVRASILDENPGDPNKWWLVEQHFDTQPYCLEEDISDPLLTPDRVDGGFIRYTVEAVKDRFGALMDSSSHEMFRGPQVEFDEVRPTVKIIQNRLLTDLADLNESVNTVNELELWGYPPRQIKLGNITWQTMYYGACSKYYRRELDFEINVKTFDRLILDEGTKVLNGHWGDTPGTGSGSAPGDDIGTWILDDIGGLPPDPNNQQHFIRFKDRNGENARVILNGAGVPANGNIAGAPLVFPQSPSDANPGSSTFPTGPPKEWTIEYYEETDFLLTLNVPANIQQ